MVMPVFVSMAELSGVHGGVAHLSDNLISQVIQEWQGL